jgi:hypothetical protein
MGFLSTAFCHPMAEGSSCAALPKAHLWRELGTKATFIMRCCLKYYQHVLSKFTGYCHYNEKFVATLPGVAVDLPCALSIGL